MKSKAKPVRKKGAAVRVKRMVSRRWRDRKCALCNGRGLVPVTVIDVTADFECPNCNGTGNAGRWESANDQAQRRRP